MKKLLTKPLIINIFLWFIICIIYFLPILPCNRVWAPIDILDNLLKPWATEVVEINIKNAYPYDAISQYIPYDYAIYKGLQEDGYIGWNPLVHNGTSLKENTMLCPGSFRHFFYRFLPFWDAWDLGRIMHIFIAGIGMFYLFYSLRIPYQYYLLGAISFAFSSQFIVWLHTDVISSGCCFSPYIIASLLLLKNEFLKEKKSPRFIFLYFAASSIFIGLGLRNGFLHTTLFNFTLTLLIIIHEIINYIKNKKHRSAHTYIHTYILSLLIGIIIALPVLYNVIPPAMNGGHPLHLKYGIRTIPSLVTSFLPYIGGTPQGLDIWKVFGTDLFNTKFSGSILFALALIASFNKHISTLPRTIFIVFLLIPFTPLSTWYYSRCAIITALITPWITVELLQKKCCTKKIISFAIKLFILFTLLWFFMSLIMICFKSQIIEYISSFAKSAIPQQKLTRIDWIDTRALILFDDILIWSPFNILTLLAITIGLISSLNILRGIKRQNLYIALLTLSTLLELLLFAYKWMPVSTAPSQLDQPYDDKPWTKEFKKHTNGHGSVYFIYSGDFDYMQLNTPSGHHIYQAHGYESVQPEKLEPLHQRSFNAEDYANAGISHISMHPDQIRALPSEWQIVSSNNNFKLFYNNKFIGKYIATDTNGNTTKLTTARETPSTKTFVIPQGTTNIQILETFHQKWKYSFDKKKFYPCLQNTNGYYSILIPIPQDNTSTNLYLKFFP